MSESRLAAVFGPLTTKEVYRLIRVLEEEGIHYELDLSQSDRGDAKVLVSQEDAPRVRQWITELFNIVMEVTPVHEAIGSELDYPALLVNGEVVKGGPTMERVAAALGALNEREFLVVELEPDTFLQVMLTDEKAWRVECRSGVESDLYEALKKDLTQAEVEEMFDSFLKREDGWREGCEWQALGLF